MSLRKKASAPEPLSEGVLRELDDAERLLPTLAEPERSEAAELIRRYRAPHQQGMVRLEARGRLQALGLIPEPAPAAAKPEVPEAVNRGYTKGIPIIGSTRKEPPPRKAVTVCLADVGPEEVTWLWPGRFARNTVNVIAGLGGAGKSTLVGALAATVTTGCGWPDCPGVRAEPASVMILATEEHLASGVRPRLERFGADLRRVHVLKTTADDEGRLTPFNLVRDVPILDADVARIGGVRLVVIDPVGSYLSGVENADESEVRDALSPLFTLAEKYQLAVVLVMHLNKKEGSSIQSRVAMSSAFVNQARMVWLFSKYPGDRSRRVLSPVKTNLDGASPTSLAVGYDGRSLDWDPEPLDWDAEQVAALLAHEAAKIRPSAMGRPLEEGARARALVLTMLESGPCLRSAALDSALQQKIAESTFRRVLGSLCDEGLVRRYRAAVDGDQDRRLWLKLIPRGETQGELSLDSDPAEEED